MANLKYNIPFLLVAKIGKIFGLTIIFFNNV